MVGRFLRRVPALLALATVASPARETLAAAPVSEEQATRQLCDSSPAAVIAKAERLRGEVLVVAAGVWENPSLVAEHHRTLEGAADSETIVGVSFPLGIGGRRFVLQDAAAARRDQALAEASATLFDSALAFREVYARAVAEQARVRVLEEQQRALEELNQIIRSLAKGGEAAGYDLLRQEVQGSRHLALLQATRGRAVASRALLAAWIEPGISLPAEPSLAGPTTARSVTTTNSPALRALEAAARASSLEASAARRRRVPELDVFAGYRALSAGDETGQGISVSLTLPLTFFDHGQGEAARAQAERDIALARASSLRREQRASVQAAQLRIVALERALVEVEKAVAGASAMQSKARQLYAAGESNITELLEAFRLAEEARLERLDMIEELAHARLALMRAAGTMFDAALDRACRDAPGASK